jgi:hypothetical protein
MGETQFRIGRGMGHKTFKSELLAYPRANQTVHAFEGLGRGNLDEAIERNRITNAGR